MLSLWCPGSAELDHLFTDGGGPRHVAIGRGYHQSLAVVVGGHAIVLIRTPVIWDAVEV
jgi:hypothetical protein